MTEHFPGEMSKLAMQPSYLSVPRPLLVRLGYGVMGGIGATLLGGMIHADGWRRVMLAYLVAFAFVLSLSLGSLFFVLVQHLMRAGWSVLVRRPAEVLALNLVTVGVLFLPILLVVFDGTGRLYPWAGSDKESPLPHAQVVQQATQVVLSNESRGEQGSESREPADHATSHDLYVHQQVDALTRSKQSWLNPTAYLLRNCVYFAVWIGIAWFYFQRSRNQDLTGGDRQTRSMEWWSGLCMFAFGITLTYAAFDLLMSLDPHWYSTIFGVYYFAGCAVGGFSINLLSILLLQQFGRFPAVLSDEHRRDLGRLLFAFVFFWCYIAYSQYMLLWYANVPETTRWLVVRGASTAQGYSNSWGLLLSFLLFGHFIVPFLGMMSRHVKTHRKAMVGWTIWLLCMHYLDLYWLVMPELGPRLTIGLPECGTLVAVGCVYLLGAAMIATRISLIPTEDPRLSASVAISEAY
jgi:hypothetical protein